MASYILPPSLEEGISMNSEKQDRPDFFKGVVKRKLLGNNGGFMSLCCVGNWEKAELNFLFT